MCTKFKPELHPRDSNSNEHPQHMFLWRIALTGGKKGRGDFQFSKAGQGAPLLRRPPSSTTAVTKLSRQGIIMVLIRLHWCAGWSAPLLFAYGINMVAEHVTNDVCFADLMEAAILKILLAWRWFSHFYDAEKRLLTNKWSSRVFKKT